MAKTGQQNGRQNGPTRSQSDSDRRRSISGKKSGNPSDGQSSSNQKERVPKEHDNRHFSPKR